MRIIAASFGGIFGLCLGGSVLSIIELVYLLTRQLFRRQLRKEQEQSRTKLPPASEVFLSIPVKVHLQKPRDRQRLDNNQSTFHHCKTINLNDMYHVKRVKF